LGRGGWKNQITMAIIAILLSMCDMIQVFKYKVGLSVGNVKKEEFQGEDSTSCKPCDAMGSRCRLTGALMEALS
jgi:hypothetical protein